MSYNPYVAAFAALTNQEARRFYLVTAIEHTFLLIAVTAIAANRTIEAGKATRQFVDSAIAPYTMFAIAMVVEFFTKPDAPKTQEQKTPVLAGFIPIALLPPSKPMERVLITPVVTVERVLITPAPQVELVESLTDIERYYLSDQDEYLEAPEETEVTNYDLMSYKALQALCKQRRLNAKGSKQDLQARLCRADLFAEPSVNWKLAPRPRSRMIRGIAIE